jgi:predicted permease
MERPRWLAARLSSLVSRLYSAVRRRNRPQHDFAAELQAHLALEADRLREAGLSEEEALAAARRNLGNVTSIRERFYESHSWLWLDHLLQDVRYGLRQLRRSPGFTAVAVLTLALGIGANTAIFSLIDAVMLRSLPVREPSQLVLFRWQARHSFINGEYSGFGDCPGGGRSSPAGCSFPFPFFETMESETNAFSGVVAFAGPAQLDLSGNGPPSIATGELVSGSYFSVLGVGAVLGRKIGAEDDRLASSPVVVLSYDYWQKAFGGKKSVIGRTIVLDNVPFTIVGVAEPSFATLSPGKTQDFFLPIAMLPRLGIDWAHQNREISNWWLVMMGRLRSGVSLGRAQAAASLLFRNEMLHGAKPFAKPADDPSIALVPAQSGLTGRRGDFSSQLYVLMFAVGLLLLIACANVGGLLLARGTARTKELALRLAVGATHARILRQLLTESITLSLMGGAIGILFASWGVHVLTRLATGGNFTVAPDWRILAFTAFVSLLSGVLFGLAPASHSARLDLSPTLKENAPVAPSGGERVWRRIRLGNALVAIQVGLSVVVLVGAGLLVRTLRSLRDVNPGFDTQNLLLFSIDPTLNGYKPAQIQNLYQRLQSRLAALPGVADVSYSSNALLTGHVWTTEVHIEGQPQKKQVTTDMLAAGPGFFRTLGIPLLAGRTFTREDFEKAALAVPSGKAGQPHAGAPLMLPAIPIIVNRVFAHRYFPNANALGKYLGQGNSSSFDTGGVAAGKPRRGGFEIVGIVGNTKYSTLTRAIHPAIFVPLTGGGAHFELRTAGNPALLMPTVRNVAQQVDSRLPLFNVRTQTEAVDELLVQQRLMARLASFFGAVAVLLACIGLYGLLSFEVGRRTREMGIRMALGAERGEVVKLVAGQGFRLTLIGLGIGIAAALALTRFLASLLYGVKTADPVTFTAVSAILMGVALLASFIPARRAAKVDPMVALRHE